MRNVVSSHRKAWIFAEFIFEAACGDLGPKVCFGTSFVFWEIQKATLRTQFPYLAVVRERVWSHPTLQGHISIDFGLVLDCFWKDVGPVWIDFQ